MNHEQYRATIGVQELPTPKWLDVNALRNFMLGDPRNDQWKYTVKQRYPRKGLDPLKNLPTKF